MKYFLLINIFYLLLFAEEYEKLELHRMCDGGDNCVAISHSYDTDDLQILLEKIPVLEIKKKEISKANIENMEDATKLVSLKLSIDKVEELHQKVPEELSGKLFVVSNGL